MNKITVTNGAMSIVINVSRSVTIDELKELTSVASCQFTDDRYEGEWLIDGEFATIDIRADELGNITLL